MDIQQIIQNQGAAPWHWHIVQTPFMFLAFFIFFIGALAEGNRMPFDMPEAESELVSGYNTEYSGFRFVLFFFAEFANLYLIGAITSILFLGGWQAGPLPGFVIGLFGAQSTLAVALITNIIEFLVFQVKILSLVFVVIQLRWTLPRVRVDQLMIMCWKYLVPVAFINLLAMCLWVLFVPDHITQLVAYGMTVLAAVIDSYYLYRVYVHIKLAKPKMRFNPMS